MTLQHEFTQRFYFLTEWTLEFNALGPLSGDMIKAGTREIKSLKRRTL